MARRTLGDLRAIPGEEEITLSCAEELESARDLLTAGGVDVTVTWPPDLAVPPEVDALLATVLREGVTNVMRHSTAGRCAIEVCHEDGQVRLRIANDGVPDSPQAPPGQGVTNLTARVRALGGTLSTRPHPDGTFELAVTQPGAPA